MAGCVVLCEAASGSVAAFATVWLSGYVAVAAWLSELESEYLLSRYRFQGNLFYTNYSAQ